MIKLNKIKRNCIAAVILTMCLMTAGCARNSTTTTASGSQTTITSGITKDDTDVTHADDAENYRVAITGDFTVTSDISDGVTQSGSVYTITKAGEYTVSGLLSDPECRNLGDGRCYAGRLFDSGGEPGNDTGDSVFHVQHKEGDIPAGNTVEAG